MFFYLFIYTLSCLCIFQGQRTKLKWNIFSILGILIPTIVAAQRGEMVGTDTTTYLWLYNAASILSFDEFLSSNRVSVEPFFYLSSLIGKYFTGFSTVCFIYQGLGLVFLYLVAYKFRKHLEIALVFFLYFTLIFPYSLNIMRQVLAMLYLLWLGTFLLKNKWIKFIFFGLCGIVIHSSIIAGILIILWCYWIYISSPKIQKRLIWLSIIGFCGLAILLRQIGPILSMLDVGELSRYGNYIEKGSSYLGKTDLVVRLAFLTLYLWAIRKKIINKSLGITASILIGFESILIICGSLATVIFRLSLYCTVIDILFIPYILYSKKFSYQSRNLAQWLLMGISTIYWWYTMVLNGTNETIPYYT